MYPRLWVCLWSCFYEFHKFLKRLSRECLVDFDPSFSVSMTAWVLGISKVIFGNGMSLKNSHKNPQKVLPFHTIICRFLKGEVRQKNSFALLLCPPVIIIIIMWEICCLWKKTKFYFISTISIFQVNKRNAQ